MSSFSDPQTDSQKLVSNLNYVQEKIQHAKAAANRIDDISLVAVSKTKSSSDIKVLYDAGHRQFGENYFQELLEKSQELSELKDIKWHFIGHLQSQKAAKLVKSVSNLSVVETVDTLKLASKLNNACVAAERSNLDIYLQVHTSEEETKSGVTPVELMELVLAVRAECPRLTIRGLMTIGAPDDLSCFDKLAACRVDVASQLEVPIESLALSMGMSGDYEDAVAKGATSIRVGSTIFGARDYSKA